MSSDSLRADQRALPRAACHSNAIFDNGVGIAAATLPKIFDMFMQIDRSHYLSQGGLGIGLTLVRRFVELHGGSVHANSGGLNRGSQFVVRLPLNDS